jgi:hypothetical protein
MTTDNGIHSVLVGYILRIFGFLGVHRGQLLSERQRASGAKPCRR